MTIDTYDQSAEELAAYFKGIGPRVKDIERAFELAGHPHVPRVVEIGCGDGRDAAEIVTRAAWYEGFDPSEGLLDIARKKVPDASFVKADALSYTYPPNLDVVFAFASLLHVNKDDLTHVCQKVAKALRQGGIFYISLKERSEYAEEIKADQYGERMFYYYTADLVKELAGDAFQAVHEEHMHHGNTDWFNIALKRL